MIGERIKRLREEKGYSITELANCANVSKSYLSYIERNLNRNPSIQFLIKVAKPLDVTIEYLLTGIDAEDKKDELFGKELMDNEWRILIEKAIQDGLKKDDFREYLNFIKFINWKKEQ